jgi:hypothetical protein
MLQVSHLEIAFKLPKPSGWNFQSSVEVLGTEFQVMVLEANKAKCPRCWIYAAETDGELCERCSNVLSEKPGQKEYLNTASNRIP